MAMAKTDYVREVGGKALVARLRRLSDQIDRDAARCYKHFGVRFEQRWFGVINQLQLNGEMSVGELAEALGITHVSVSQARKSLEAEALIASSPDPQDGRRSVLSLTAKGEKLIATLKPLWDALIAASEELDRETQGVASALDRLDDALERHTLFERVCAQLE